MRMNLLPRRYQGSATFIFPQYRAVQSMLVCGRVLTIIACIFAFSPAAGMGFGKTAYAAAAGGSYSAWDLWVSQPHPPHAASSHTVDYRAPLQDEKGVSRFTASAEREEQSVAAAATVWEPYTENAARYDEDEEQEEPDLTEALPTLEERLPASILERGDKFLTFTLENDKFGSGNDQHYTNGFRFTYMEVGQEPDLIGRTLGRYIPVFEVNDTTSTFYSFGQNLYTPEEIEDAVPDPEDRPYAGFLYISAGFSTVRGDHNDIVEATIGVVGPWALGEETQETVHDLLDTTDPNGWEYQLDNEPGLILSWERNWPEALTYENQAYLIRLVPHVGASLGNVYTYGSTGASIQMTPSAYRWQTTPMRVRPAIPGTGVFEIPEGEFAWSLFAGIDGRAVARNIFLDGNSFEDSPSVDKKYFVMDANVGASLTYGRTSLSYTLNWRSEEFDNQEDPALFGALSVSYRF